MNKLTTWYQQLQQREKNMLLAMSAFIILTLFYLLIWEPVISGSKLEYEKLQSQKKILIWMQDAEKKVAALKSSGQQISSQYANQSINTLIERSAVSAGVRSSINKLDSEGQQSMKVQFKSVDFDRLMQWLGKLQIDYGITPKHVTINRLEENGLVNCRLTLEKVSL